MSGQVASIVPSRGEKTESRPSAHYSLGCGLGAMYACYGRRTRTGAWHSAPSSGSLTCSGCRWLDVPWPLTCIRTTTRTSRAHKVRG